MPFGKLLELGLLRPGDRLYLHKTGQEAVVLANGVIKSGMYEGSIHSVGTDLLGAPCNGWVSWDYVSLKTGKRESINLLRTSARKLLTPKKLPKGEGKKK